MLNKDELFPLAKCRMYLGKFTGKMVKPLVKIEDFKRGDEVVIIHAKDYFKWRESIDLVLKEFESLKENRN